MDEVTTGDVEYFEEDISNEDYREYIWYDDIVYIVSNPSRLISDSDDVDHTIIDKNGVYHRISTGWIAYRAEFQTKLATNEEETLNGSLH